MLILRCLLANLGAFQVNADTQLQNINKGTNEQPVQTNTNRQTHIDKHLKWDVYKSVSIVVKVSKQFSVHVVSRC